MSSVLPFLHDLQMGVARGVNARFVVYLFFRIMDRQKFVEGLPSAADAPEPEDDGNGLGVRRAVFHSEAWHIDRSHESKRSKTGHAEVAARGERLTNDKNEHLRFVPCANIAFTYGGLRKLGVCEQTLESFPEPFREGMAHRAAVLGDDGPAAPELWDGYLGSREIHGVTWSSIFLLDPDPAAMEKLYSDLNAQIKSISLASKPLVPRSPGPIPRSPQAQQGSFDVAPIQGAELLHVEFGFANYRNANGGECPYRIEHFGFREGISQPYVNIGLESPPPGGGTPRADNSWAPVALGELLLGHPDEDNFVQPLPANRQLRNNGTYMVFRKLEQDVVGFRNFMKRHDRSGIANRLAAQAVGRWPDGSPFIRYPNGPESSGLSSLKRTINNFRYQVEDPFGRRCPIGAHIRRVNPRDTNDRDEARRHRLFRRGISYGGSVLPEDSTGDGVERGLLFIAMQARIDQQFEFVQANWLNRGEFVGQAGARLDPLTGPHAGRVDDAFQTVDDPAPITHLPRFVTLRGGDYFFVPSFTALAAFKADYKFPAEKAADPSAPVLTDSIGSILPSNTDNSPELIEIGKKLLEKEQPFYSLPRITTTPFPGGPAIPVKTIVVGRHDYVTSVLLNDGDFSNELFDARSRAITGGGGLLIGLAAADQERDKRLKVLHDALMLLGPLPIAEIAEGLTKGVLERVLPAGRLDVVKDFGRVVPILSAGVLFGVLGPAFVSPTAIATLFGRFDVTDVPDDWLRTLPPMEDYAKPLTTMQSWTRLAFLQIFVNIVNAAEITAPAERGVREFLRQIDALVLKARASQTGTTYQELGRPRNLLEALVRVPLDPTDKPDPARHIRLILAEFTAGAVETVNTALTNILNFLLDHQDEVKTAICDHLKPGFLCNDQTTLDTLIARLSDQDIDVLIYEILRFDPMGPLAFRTCVNRTSIGGATVDPGTIVCLVTAAAMQDPNIFSHPETIRFDRPLDKYLHFGNGLHQCKGQMIIDPVVFPIAMPILRTLFKRIATLPRLRRAAGDAGNRKRTFPILSDALTLRFG